MGVLCRVSAVEMPCGGLNLRLWSRAEFSQNLFQIGTYQWTYSVKAARVFTPDGEAGIKIFPCESRV